MGRPKIVIDNTKVADHLFQYSFWQDAAREWNRDIDHILAGVSLLDWHGNTRPLSMEKLYFLLQNLPVISVRAIAAATGDSDGHCRKLAQALRVASREVAKVLEAEQAAVTAIKLDPPEFRPIAVLGRRVTKLKHRRRPSTGRCERATGKAIWRGDSEFGEDEDKHEIEDEDAGFLRWGRLPWRKVAQEAPATPVVSA